MALSIQALMGRDRSARGSVLGSVGTIITAAGETSRTPTTDASWQAAVNAAATLAEASNLLMMPRRAWDDKEWMQYARQLQRTATAGMKARRRRTSERVPYRLKTFPPAATAI